jgi:hypothetical protein
MKKLRTISILLLLLTVACTSELIETENSIPNTSGSTEVLSNEATIQSDEIPKPSFVVSTVSEITFYAGNFRLDDTGRLINDFCFDLIDTNDWAIGNLQVIDAKGITIYPSEGELLIDRLPPTIIDGKNKQLIIDLRSTSSQDVKKYYIDAAPDKKAGQRCVSITYHSQLNFNLPKFTVVIDDIVAYPREGEQSSKITVQGPWSFEGSVK